ncbi:pyridoxamine 5'-phosphate oxidase family protein [Paenibacillus kyungheensis]|uniref:Pyridoxamine 5'-phosphate oxidase family protein n=1 Tax=Paenibacillus kyungheensis TaxID=1452732 RepID=A0AAX3M048_9BACL|nr:pyridoxamine 5'-phosphate oxidase family protein [Paenibacillus kyungheensis]WCT55526.1 pyridoxamine 5'-phosphate oxidase family protein [Paenibacillus kyungheensis]
MNTVTLSSVLLELFNGQHLQSKQQLAMPLLTVNEDGYPHQAMVSVGEVIATDSNHLRLALWEGTTTTGNIIRTGQALLTLVWQGVSYALRLSLTPLPALPEATYARARFVATIEHIREDTAKYATLTSGITIELHQAENVLERWQHTLQELLQ